MQNFFFIFYVLKKLYYVHLRKIMSTGHLCLYSKMRNRQHGSTFRFSRIIQFCFSRIFCPFLFFFLVMIKDRSHVPASRLSIVHSDRHVSDDFPIKPAEQLSIDGNQRLLSACPAIILGIEARSWALHDRAKFSTGNFLRLAESRNRKQIKYPLYNRLYRKKKESRRAKLTHRLQRIHAFASKKFLYIFSPLFQFNFNFNLIILKIVGKIFLMFIIVKKKNVSLIKDDYLIVNDILCNS